MSAICFGILFSIIGFVLHFSWEYIQCSRFFLHIENAPTPGAMAFAAAGDIVIMWTVYLMVALKYRTFTWFQKLWNLVMNLNLVGFSVLLAIFVELWALKTERWAYTQINPILPFLGISLLPVLQMALINPVSFYGGKKIIDRLARKTISHDSRTNNNC